MVFLGNEGGERKGEKPMERSKPLHNFSMPCLKWGNQRFLRCMKVNSNGEASAVDHRYSASEVENGSIGRRRGSEFERRGSSDRRRESSKVWPSPTTEVGSSARKSKAGDDGIEAIREKLMFDIQAAAHKMKDAILREGLVKEQLPPAMSPTPAETEAVRPWNLRTRRAACKARLNGVNGGGNGGGNDGRGKSLKIPIFKPNSLPLRNEGKSSRFRSDLAAVTSSPCSEKRKRAKFSISLSRCEIEEDFMEMAARKLPYRPKKRPKNVQKQLDYLFPGLWLTEVNADLYKVPDAPEYRKR